jgi:DNA primase
LPDKKDPDDVIREDPEIWKKAISKPKLFLDFAFDQTTQGKDLTDVEDKKFVAGVLLPLISNIGNNVEQTHYLQKLSALIRVEEDVLRGSLKKEKDAVQSKRRTEQALSGESKKDGPAQELLSVLMKKPTWYSFVAENLSIPAIQQPDLQKLYTIIDNQYNETHELDIDQLRKLLLSDPSTAPLITYMDVAELGAARLPDKVEHVGEELVNLMMRAHLKTELTKLSADILTAEKAQDKQKLEELIARFDAITRELKKYTSNM